MHRLIRSFAVISVMLAAVHALSAREEIVTLPEFRVEGTPWLYARAGDMEILTRASPARTRKLAAALVRGERFFPDFFMKNPALPLKVIVVDANTLAPQGIGPGVESEADARRWPPGYLWTRGHSYNLADDRIRVFGINLGTRSKLWEIVIDSSNRHVLAQRPAFPGWVTTGLLGPVGPLNGVIGIPNTTSVRLPQLSWPDEAVPPGKFPTEAGDTPEFAAMFDSARSAEDMPQAERWRFEFQTALFARWSLFGPAKNGRNRNGYWVFAEMARRGQATEEVFHECYGMDWEQARSEMRAYLKPRHTGVLEVRMPTVMTDVPEVERMEFREATLEEVRRILGEFNRLRAAEAEREAAAKAPGASSPARS